MDENKFDNVFSCMDTMHKCDRLTDTGQWLIPCLHIPSLGKQEAQLMLTTIVMRLAISRGQQTWYHFGSVATFR